MKEVVLAQTRQSIFIDSDMRDLVLAFACTQGTPEASLPFRSAMVTEWPRVLYWSARDNDDGLRHCIPIAVILERDSSLLKEV